MTRDELERIIHRYQAELFRYVRYLGASEAGAAEDVVQDVFLAAWSNENPPPLTDEPRMAGWLRGITRNLFLMHCRRNRISPVHVDSEWLTQAEAHWEAEGLGGEEEGPRQEALRRCMQKLTDRERGALNDRYRERLPRDEMARRLKMTDNGVKSLLRRLRKNLADCIRRQLASGTEQ